MNQLDLGEQLLDLNENNKENNNNNNSNDILFIHSNNIFEKNDFNELELNSLFLTMFYRVDKCENTF